MPMPMQNFSAQPFLHDDLTCNKQSGIFTIRRFEFFYCIVKYPEMYAISCSMMVGTIFGYLG
jgi:hypothetical protein